jgi:ADP-ribose pyrophosphatase YjhB (NUDIX family)
VEKETMSKEELHENKREYPKMPFVGVGAVVIKNGRILLIKRAFEPGAGKWSIPGGLVEVGERLSEACAREAEEETGIQIEILELINVFDMIDKDENGKVKYHYVLVDFLAKPTGGEERKCAEVTEIQWATHDEAKKMDLTKTARRALEELFGSSVA